MIKARICQGGRFFQTAFGWWDLYVLILYNHYY